MMFYFVEEIVPLMDKLDVEVYPNYTFEFVKEDKK